VKSPDVTRAITAMIFLSTFSRARQILMKRLLPLLGHATDNLRIGREKENGRNLNSEVVPQRLPALPRPSLDEGSPTSPSLARGRNRFLDDFEKELWERTRSPPKARPLPKLPSEGGDKFLDDLEKVVQRFILEQHQRG
jgi:hypothetical protein